MAKQEKVIADLKAKEAERPLTDDEVKLQRQAWDKLDVPIRYDGRAITLPAEPSNMPLDKAITALMRLRVDEEQDYKVHEMFDAYPHDAAVAFVKAAQRLYGFASFGSEGHKTPFGVFEEPPEMISVKTGIGDNDFVLVPLGELKLPGVNQPIKTRFYHDDDNDKTVFLVHGTIKKKDRHIVLELANETRAILKAESIYRGKPLRIKVDSDGDLDTDNPPEFMDVTEMTEESVLFDADIHDQILTNILVPIKHTKECQKHGIPIKRTALLEGPFGTGKSLTARLIARVAENHGWTFILLDRVQGLKAALEFANRYAPAVVFAEDIDRIASERTDDMNDLINVIDGVISKRSQIMTVLTTNFLEKLNPVILRPGRLDAVISIRAPGPKTVERLIRHYAGGLLADEVDLTNSGEELKGQIPATIRESVERAKLGMIGRGGDTLIDRDIVIAGQTMKTHLEALNRDHKVESNADTLARSLSAIVNGSGDDIKAINDMVGKIHDRVC